MQCHDEMKINLHIKIISLNQWINQSIKLKIVICRILIVTVSRSEWVSDWQLNKVAINRPGPCVRRVKDAVTTVSLTQSVSCRPCNFDSVLSDYHDMTCQCQSMQDLTRTGLSFMNRPTWFDMNSCCQFWMDGVEILVLQLSPGQCNCLQCRSKWYNNFRNLSLLVTVKNTMWPAIWRRHGK